MGGRLEDHPSLSIAAALERMERKSFDWRRPLAMVMSWAEAPPEPQPDWLERWMAMVPMSSAARRLL